MADGGFLFSPEHPKQRTLAGKAHMSFFDLVRELRTGEPNVNKAAKTMKFFGWGCLFGGLWNFILPRTAPFKEAGFHFPPSYPYLALISLTIIGALFLLSSRGIREMEPWGKKTGQVAVALLLGAIILFPVLVMLPGIARFPGPEGPFRIVLYLFFAVGMAQFALPAFFGIRYLGRLPTKEDQYNPARYNPEQISRNLAERMNGENFAHQAETRYKDSPFPFGITGTFALLIAVPLLLMLVGQSYAGQKAILLFVPFVFLFIFLGPPLFNYFPSPFQQDRKLVAAFTGGGSIFLFHGSWPFFRLMVYGDALEVRVMFHRFLVPYEKMADVSDKVGFFSMGFEIHSDLPDVPSSIRFGGFGLKKIIRIVRDTRNSFLLASQEENRRGQLLTKE